jgi:hypothetical protein
MKLSPVIRGRGHDRVCVGFLLSCGRKGWNAYEENGQPLACSITSMTLPGLSIGKERLIAIRVRRGTSAARPVQASPGEALSGAETLTGDS